MEQITLYYRKGSSDKVYQASVEPRGEQFVVNYAYGRRGAAMTAGTKTTAGVSLQAARAIYAKLVGEKKAKGYTPGENGAPYQSTARAEAVSGVQCQLLNPIEPSEVGRYANDPDFAMQEKFDGRRLLIRKTAVGIEGINRKGLIVALPCQLVEDAEALPGAFLIDGEQVGRPTSPSTCCS